MEAVDGILLDDGSEEAPGKDGKLDEVEKLVREIEDQFRDQAMQASQNMDLVQAKEEMKALMEEVAAAQGRLDQAAKSAKDLKRDLAQANDRSLVINAENHANLDKEMLQIAAQAHLRQCRCRDKAGEPWPLWSTRAEDLQEYGTGIALFFKFTIILSQAALLCGCLTVPFLLLNFTGSGLAEVDVATGEHGLLATGSLGNFLSTEGFISLSRFDITAADASLFVGSLDALAAALLLLLALWYERVALPLAVKREARTFVTPDAYTIFVSGLPRRLSEEKHVHYEELLRAHFERQMSSELLGEELLRGLNGWRVVAEKERHLDEPPKASCCGARGLDKRGRRLGVLTDVREEGCLVRWPDATGRLLPPELCSGGLLQADLLARLEDVGCEASEGREAVYNVSLIRDFKGKLRGMRRVVERAKKIDEEGKGTVEEEKELLEAEEELRDLNLEEKDVLGAFVTFNYIKFKDFVSQEYRFSQLFLLGSFLQGEDQRFEGNALKIDEAPLPSDIFWENFDCPKSRRRLKTLLVGLTFLTLLVVMILGLSLAKWGREAAQSQSPDCSPYVNVTGQEDQPLHCYCGQQGLANVLQDRPTGLRALCQGYLQSFALVQGMIVGAAVFSAVINVASGQLIARLAHFMQPPNWTALEATIMEMTFLVQLLTLGVVVTLVNADFQFGLGAPKGILGLIGAGEFQDIDRAWTAAVGVEILTLFIFSLSSEAVSALSVLYFKLSCWLLGRQKQSWKEMKALYTPADFELALHQASQLSATCAALMYASCLPLLYLLLALRLFLMYWSAKFELLRGSQVPKRFSHVLAMASCRWVQVAVFAHCSVAIWVYGDATLTGTTHLVWDSEATSYMAQLRRVLGDQLSVVMEIVVEKAMTPAAMGNALILAFLCFMWAMKLVSFLVGDAEWQQLKSTVLKVFPKALRTPQRRGVFEQSFEKEPMQEMLRMKINPSYELWRSSGFEFLRPGQAGSIQEMLAEAKRRREEDAKNLLAKRDEEDRAAQHFLPIQIIGQATDTE